jgi:hypothetical protein
MERSTNKPVSFISVLSFLPYFLLLFPLFIVLHTENLFHHLIDYHFVWKDILFLFLVPWLAFIFFYFLVRRSWMNASVCTALFLFFFYFTGVVKPVLNRLHTVFAHYNVLLTCIFLILAGAVLLLRKKKIHRKTIVFLNLLFIVLNAIEFIQLITDKKSSTDLGDHSKQISNMYTPCIGCVKPDIYYILFDGYSSSKSLLENFNFRNEQLDSFLIQNRFYIPVNSKSNYNLTPFSISSCFNMNYLSGIDTLKDYYQTDFMPGINSVYRNELFPILQKEKYRILNLSIFNVKDYPAKVPPFDMWDLTYLYQRHNLFQTLHNDIGWNFHWGFAGDPGSYSANRDHHFEATLDEFSRSVKQHHEAPTFTYAHFFIPHGPFTYDSSGHKKKVQFYLSATESKTAYVEQVKFCNRVIQKIIKEIMDNKDTARPVVIILQGDHGFRFYDRTKKEKEFPNLSAFYFSNGDYSQLYDSISNVNTFRVVFNTFFKQKYPLLKDRSFFLNYK